MKFIKTIESNWRNAIFYTLALTSVSAYSHQTADGEMALTINQEIKSCISQQDQIIVKFFDSGSDVPYKNILSALVKKEQEYASKINSLEPVGHLSKKSQAIFQEILKLFSPFLAVMKQYNGKTADQAMNFVTDLEKLFSPEAAFKTILTRLQDLLKDAQEAQETELITLVQQLIAITQKKKTEWYKRSKLTLFAGLAKRMHK